MTYYNQVIERLTGIRDNTSGVSTSGNQSRILDDIAIVDEIVDSELVNQSVILNIIHEIQDVIIYPTTEDSGTTAITDDGTNSVYLTEASLVNTTIWTSSWSEDINFEQSGNINVVSNSMDIQFGIRTNNTNCTVAAKFQISGDSGATWVDVTDDVASNSTAWENKTRVGTGNWIPNITSGANQLEYRLMHRNVTGTGSQVFTKMRTNTYNQLTYRKS